MKRLIVCCAGTWNRPVGGGYRDPTLSEIPLLWMIDEARDCGLAFKPDRVVLHKPASDDEHRRTRARRPLITRNALGFQ